MKNSTLIKFNLKKTIIAIFCFVLGLAISSFFVLFFGNEQTEIQCAQAVAMEESLKETEEQNEEEKFYRLNLYTPSDDEVSPASVSFGKGTGYTWTSSMGTGVSLPAGTIFSISKTSPENQNIQIIVDENTSYTVTLNLTIGYQLTGYTFESGNGEKQPVNFESDFSATTETLDPNFSGTITITPSVGYVDYNVNLYYENSNNVFTYKTEQYTIDASHPLNVASVRPDSSPSKKGFNAWILRKNVLTNNTYNGYTVTIPSTTSGTITMTKDDNGDGTNDYSINLSYTSVSGDYYTLSYIYGYGNLEQTSNYLIIATYLNIYNVTVNNSSTYWSGFTSIQNDTDLYGAGNNNSFSKSVTIPISYQATSAVFMTSLSRGTGLAFKKRSEIASYKVQYTIDLSTYSYYVYNYGHYITGWSIEISNISTTYTDDNFSTLYQLATWLDTYMIGRTGLPTITITPSWAAATVKAKAGSTPLGSTSFAGFYGLSGGSAGSGKTLFAYQDSAESLVATSGVWNYTSLTGYSGSSASSYIINLTAVGLDNVYRVDLNDVRADEDGAYKLADKNYSYYSQTGTYNGTTLAILPYNDSNLGKAVTAYNSSTYPLIDNYITYLKTYREGYNDLINTGSSSYSSIFNYVYYSNGTESGSNLTGASSPKFWIYLANAQTVRPLPTFETKYYKTVYWTNGGNSGLETDAWNDDEYGTELGLTSLSDSWDSSFGTTATAYYMKKLNLYYKDDSATSYDYITAELYGSAYQLDFSAAGEDLEFNNSIYGGWIFNVTTATSQAYGYSISGTISNGETLIVTNGDLTTSFYIEKVNDQYPNLLLYVTKVQGDAFIQDDSNPIITMRHAHKYNFVVDNQNTYWANFSETNGNTDLYGAQFHIEEENTFEKSNGGLTASFQIADRTSDEYSFMSSQTDSGKGLAFYHGDNFDEKYASTSGNDYYYVYNYGHEITGWEITFAFTTNSGKNGTIGVLSSSLLQAVSGSTSTYCDINLIINMDLTEIARAIDDYMLANGIIEIPTVTMKPVWEGVDLNILLNNTTTSLGTATFGDENYSLDESKVTISAGQSLFAFKTGDGKFISSPGGRWNYQTIDVGQFTLNPGLNLYNGTYQISLIPEFVDNIYKINLNNVIQLETNKYQLEAGTFESSDSSYLNKFTYETFSETAQSGSYTFSRYKDSDDKLIDAYIDASLSVSYKNYLEGIDGNGTNDFAIFGKVFTSGGTISNSNKTLTTTSTPTLFIYLANLQPVGTLPEFENELSKLILWENNNGIFAYPTESYGDDYIKELKSEDGTKTYTKFDNWEYSHGGSEGNFSIKARYVYSVKMYYTSGTSYNYVNSADEKFGIGYFGRYTDVSFIDGNDFTVYLDSNQWPTDKTFERWVFDVESAQTKFGADKVTINTSANTITVTTDEDKWVFAYSEANTYFDNYYYITGVKSGYTRFIQDESAPIIFAKWANLFDLTVDNTTASYWSSVDSTNTTLYGAYSSQTDHSFTNGEFNKTTFKISNDDDYKFKFMTSENGGTGLSFYHLTDWSEDEYVTAPSGDYYLFSYGQYIDGYKITLTFNSGIYYLTYNGAWRYSSDSASSIVISSLTATDMKQMSAAADELAVKHNRETGTITMVPVWKNANIQVNLNATIINKNLATISFANKYTFNDIAEEKIAKSIMFYYYSGNRENVIASVNNDSGYAGIWNYQNINASDFDSYSTGSTVGAGTYTLTLTPYYVDNIYKVTLNNAVSKIDKDAGTKTYELTNCDYSFNTSAGAYKNNDVNELTFQNKLDEDYTFSAYDNSDLMDSYIESLKGLINAYEVGIDIDINNDLCFDIFNKVYYSTSGTTDSENLKYTVSASAEPTFNIYLANAQKTGALPVFKKTSYALIFWENDALAPDADGDIGDKYVYTTNEYNPDLHSTELTVNPEASDEYNRLIHEEEETVGRWFLTDDNQNNEEVSFTAVYYRKNYVVEVSTNNVDEGFNNAVEQRGYVVLDIVDQLHNEDPTIKNTGGSYLIIFNGEKMVAYKSETTIQTSLVSDEVENLMTATYQGSQIKLYEGSYVTMRVFDQGKDVDAMKSQEYDIMIGYKFSGDITQKIYEGDNEIAIDESKYLFTDNLDDYTFTADMYDEDALDRRDYKNKYKITIAVGFIRIDYNLTIEIDNTNAGQFYTTQNGIKNGTLNTQLNLSNVNVQESYLFDYYAYAGFKLENNAFILVYNNDNSKAKTLQSYNENEGNIEQAYLVTGGFYSGEDLGTLDGTWLREYFYCFVTDYNVEETELGTLWIKTEAILFNFGLKIYDDSNVDYPDGIIETVESSELNNLTFQLNEKTGNANTKPISTFLTTDGYGFWHYYSKEHETSYALLSSRLYFTNNPTAEEEKDKNDYKKYDFLLKTTPTNYSTLIQSTLAKMVLKHVEGQIISVDDRNIYIMLEVRELLEIEMKVAKLNNDPNKSTRTTTLSNGKNNSVEIKIYANQNASTASISALTTIGYYDVTMSAYTYVGLENKLTSVFGNEYDRVEYYLNGSSAKLEGNTFEVTKDSTLEIHYIPKGLQVEMVYMFEGEEKELSELADYLEEISKPQETAIFYQGDSVAYAVKCIHEDYSIELKINGALQGITNATNTTLSFQYAISDVDFEYGKIRIEVNVIPQDNGKIYIQYQLIDQTKKFADDNYGTFSVYQEFNGEYTLLNEDVNPVEVNIIAGRGVYIELNYDLGYVYQSVQYDSNILTTPIIENKLQVRAEFNPAEHSGVYFINLKKVDLNVMLDTTNVHQGSKYTIVGSTNNMLTSYVGSTIEFIDNPVSQERLDYFYYRNSAGEEVPLKDENGVALKSVKLTSEILKNISGDAKVLTQPTVFYVKVVERYKLEIVVDKDSTALLKENGLVLQNETSSGVYTLGEYVDVNSVILVSAEAVVTGKYHLNFKMIVPEDKTKVGENVVEITEDSIYTSIILNQDYAYTLTITPKEYEVIDVENLYTTLLAVNNQVPDVAVDEANQVNAITKSGQKYNEQAIVRFVKVAEDRELSTVFISGNDNENDMMIEFKNDSYVVYKLVGEEKVQTNLKEFGYSIELSNNLVVLTYTTYNTINIRLDYKEYKIIST